MAPEPKDTVMDTRAMTLRLPTEQAAQLDAVARVDGVSISEAARQAIHEHIESRRADPEFRAGIKRILAEERAVLEQLAK